MTNKEYFKSIYSFIKEISDKDFQERVWILGKGPEVSSYEEVMCGLYDDFNFDVFLKEHEKYDLPLNLYSCLKKLNNKLQSFKIEEFDSGFSQNNEWQTIISCAKKVVVAFEEEIFNFKNKMLIYYNKSGFENNENPQLLFFGNCAQFEHLVTIIRISIKENAKDEFQLLKGFFAENENHLAFYNSNKNIIESNNANYFSIYADKEKWQKITDVLLPLTRNPKITDLNLENSEISLIFQSSNCL